MPGVQNRPSYSGPKSRGCGLHQPLLALVEGRQRPRQLALGRLDHRPHLGRRVAGRPDAQRGRGIHQLACEALRTPDRADQDRERCRRALLARVAERALDEVGCRQVEVGGRHDDHRVLAARLGQQRQLRPPRAEQRGRLPRSGEDHPIDVGVRDQPLPERALVDVDQGEQLTRHAGIPQCLGEHRRAATRLRSRLEDDARSGRERGQHTAGGDRDAGSSRAGSPR